MSCPTNFKRHCHTKIHMYKIKPYTFEESTLTENQHQVNN